MNFFPYLSSIYFSLSFFFFFFFKDYTIAYPFQCTFPSQHDTIINIGTFYNIKKYEIIWPRMQWYHNGKNCFHSSQLHLHLRKQGEIECHYHHNFFQIFLAFLEKFLTITVSENVNGSSSSTVSSSRFLWWVGVLRCISK